MTKFSDKMPRHIYIDADLDRRLNAAYNTDRRALKKNTKGQWIHKSRSEFMAELLAAALDNEATFEGSRVVLAGKVGAHISLKLDNILLLLRTFLDLFCFAAKITDAQKNEVFKRTAADVQFNQRLTDLRAFYLDKASEKRAETAPDATPERDS